MNIKKLFHGDVVETGQTARKRDFAEFERETEGLQAEGADQDQDRVSISGFSRTLSQVSQLVHEDEADRTRRIQALKQRITDGSYHVDSKSVAKSLIHFAADSEDK